MESKNNNERVLVSFDWAIKRLLRNKGNFNVIEGFLSVLLGRKIKIVNILESESNKEHPEDKSNRVDVLVTDKSGELILIEIQFFMKTDYFQRMLYGVSKTIVEHMFESDEYMKVKKVYSINVVYFDLGYGTDYVYHGKTDFKGLHNNEILQLSDKQRKMFGKIEAGDLYPEYYFLKINNFNDVATTKLDQWIYFLKNDRIKDEFNAPGLRKARDIMDYNRLSPADRADFDYSQKIKSENRSQIATARDEGIAEAEAKAAKIIEEKDKVIEEKNKALEDKDKEIAELKRILNIK
ncbi:MAG: Rpn family recombination-promoting nuclease/putative transposase [Prevotellaceae bacterium]|jgi:predicted transposase/invertase (TIGR01784 family)|nr:Rpn family recombination-promoting nuclease/putative transposase [Prevotellaceae bacterium]